MGVPSVPVPRSSLQAPVIWPPWPSLPVVPLLHPSGHHSAVPDVGVWHPCWPVCCLHRAQASVAAWCKNRQVERMGGGTDTRTVGAWSWGIPPTTALPASSSEATVVTGVIGGIGVGGWFRFPYPVNAAEGPVGPHGAAVGVWPEAAVCPDRLRRCGLGLRQPAGQLGPRGRGAWAVGGGRSRRKAARCA